MSLANGLVGLPNVGKSTLFNALTRAGAAVANYPFCTIDPNVGVVSIPDTRLETLVGVARPGTVTPAVMTVVDIAGLVQGAGRGEGLGNQFLGHIREVDAILHVVRCFHDPNVIHVDATPNPRSDIEVIHTELLLADLEVVQRRKEKAVRAAKTGEKAHVQQLALLERLEAELSAGRPARLVNFPEVDRQSLQELGLLTAKPMLYVVNTDEEGIQGWVSDGAPTTGLDLIRQVEQLASAENSPVVPICAQLEAEVAELDPAEAEAFLAEFGLSEPILPRLLRAAYEQLGLITFYTVKGPETRAWVIPAGTKAPQAAGKIHSDMERGFIRAEVVGVDDLAHSGSFAAAKQRGLVRVEGKEYVIQDGDVLLIRFNV